VREVQHNLAALLEEVRKGREIAITKRGHVVARIVPASAAKAPVAWPDFATRMKRLAAGLSLGTPASRIIREMRRERL
jgi:prevent-host-death family protein